MSAHHCRLQVPASTSNLGAGFDALGLALELFLEVDAEFGGDRTEIEFSGEGEEEIPADRSNLIYQAFESGCRFFELQPPPVRLQIRNPIPLQRGLGSSGAAVAAGLLLAQYLTGNDGDRRRLVSLGAELEGHPENVAASLLGGLTVCCAGENGVEVIRIDPPDLRAVALIPDFAVSTQAAREMLPEQVPLQDAVFNLQRAALWIAAAQSRTWRVLREACRDALHQPYRKKLVPGFEAIVAAALEAGAVAAFLSGSGSAIVALTPADGDGVAQAMQEAAALQNFGYQARILELDSRGAIVQTSSCDA